MRTRGNRLAVALLVAPLLVACSPSGGGGATSETPAATSSTPTASPTPTTATVSQWASKVAENAPDWRKTSGRFVEDCSWVSIVMKADSGTCGIQLITMGAVGDTVVATMGGASKDLGQPPAEISALVDQLTAAGNELSASVADVPASCPDAGDKCGTPWVRAERAASALNKALNAWSPYL